MCTRHNEKNWGPFHRCEKHNLILLKLLVYFFIYANVICIYTARFKVVKLYTNITRMYLLKVLWYHLLGTVHQLSILQWSPDGGKFECICECAWVWGTYVVHHFNGTELRCAPPSCDVHLWLNYVFLISRT